MVELVMLVIVDEVMYLVEKKELMFVDCWLMFEEVECNHLLHIEVLCDYYCPREMDQHRTRKTN